MSPAQPVAHSGSHTEATGHLKLAGGVKCCAAGLDRGPTSTFSLFFSQTQAAIVHSVKMALFLSLTGKFH